MVWVLSSFLHGIIAGTSGVSGRGGVRGCRNVEGLGVFLHHPFGAKLRNNCADGILHDLDPAPWNTVTVADVVERDYFVLKDPIELLGVMFVQGMWIGQIRRQRDGPAIGPVIALAPPSIQDA